MLCLLRTNGYMFEKYIYMSYTVHVIYMSFAETVTVSGTLKYGCTLTSVTETL